MSLINPCYIVLAIGVTDNQLLSVDSVWTYKRQADLRLERLIKTQESPDYRWVIRSSYLYVKKELVSE